MVFFKPKYRKLRAERLTYASVELNKLMLKSLVNSSRINLLNKFYFRRIFCRFSKTTSIALYKNVCLFKGHSRAVFRMFKLARHKSKQYASNVFWQVCVNLLFSMVNFEIGDFVSRLNVATNMH